MLIRLTPLLILAAAYSMPVAAKNDIAWQAWSPAVFEQAKREQRFVFLYLEAVWCHWCHVMQAETFPNSDVQRLLGERYLAVKVDHDANPLLANRYRDYGWPALIFFAPDGQEIVKRAGYIAPGDFARLLKTIVEDPTPEDEEAAPVIAGPARLAPAARAHLLRLHDESYDARLGGLRTAQKFIDRDSVEYALAHHNQPSERAKAEQTLTAALALMDPVWGGAYQYSTGGVWTNPHYEKIMRVQAGYLRIYAQAWSALRRPADLAAAHSIRDYLLNFLRSPEGAFYTSQDADLVQGRKAQEYFALNDTERRKRGIPRIDKNRYAQENGQAIEALSALYETSGDDAALQAAKQAAAWVLKHRSLPGGGFRHGERDPGGPFLGDTLAMGRAFLQLYRATADRAWLEHAGRSARFIAQQFRATAAGFNTAAIQSGPVQPLPVTEENISAARFFNLLFHYSGDAAFRQQAEHAQKWLNGIAPNIPLEEIGIVLADEELTRDPLHLTVVGAKSDAVARELFAAALRAPGAYKRVEWWDRTEQALANSDVTYPELERAAGYVCTARRCSAPAFDAGRYTVQIGKLAP